jgi:hypothetical protein
MLQAVYLFLFFVCLPAQASGPCDCAAVCLVVLKLHLLKLHLLKITPVEITPVEITPVEITPRARHYYHFARAADNHLSQKQVLSRTKDERRIPVCTKCVIVKPDRAHHCSVCGQCVS